MTPADIGFAVGFYQQQLGGFAPFIERWDGVRWHRQSVTP